jgi:hypothetical protein
MSLSISVGVLVEQFDEEYHDEVKDEFEAINAALRAAGLPEHHEPEHAQGGAPWDWHIGSCSCLHGLRRVAAHLALRHALPEPSLEEPTNDPVLRQYYDTTRTETRSAQPSNLQPGIPLGVPAGSFNVTSPRPFSHLMDHTDYDGCYLPIPFAEVLVVSDGWIGSSYALRDECRELAGQLGLPGDTDLGELDRMRYQYPEIIRRPGWERFAGECFVCKALMTAAEISIQSGCALVFC